MSIPVYHITHINNLIEIVQDGELWCDTEGKKRNVSPVKIAYRNLKQRRTRASVRDQDGQPLAAGGGLG